MAQLGPGQTKRARALTHAAVPHPFSERMEELKRLDLAELYQGEPVGPQGAERMRMVAQCRPGSKVLPRFSRGRDLFHAGLP